MRGVRSAVPSAAWYSQFNVCGHAIPESLPKPGDPPYRRFEICPYCGTIAPMFTRFRQSAEIPPVPQKAVRTVRGVLPVGYPGWQKGFDLVYLALLTAEGVKRLSRVEWALKPREEQYLLGLDLQVGRVTRVTLDGNQVVHGVFSRDRELLDSYRWDFDGFPLVETSPVIRAEGYYFTYPECCVEAHIDPETRHQPNGLPSEDQAILYHWACRGCTETPRLVPRYREIWRRAQNIFRESG